MKRAIAIFRKDVRLLWVQIVTFLATLILFACEDPTYVHHEHNNVVGEQVLLYLLLPLACWVLVTSLMQAEKTVGDEQYWLTRPFSRGDLLAAKGIFLLAFVIAPVFVCQFVVLAANGFSPGQYFGAMQVKQVFFVAWLLLPVAALATVTKNLGHAFLGALLLVLGLWLFAISLESLSPAAGWGGLDWIRETATAAVVLCCLLAAVAVQYTLRRTVLARILLAGAAAVLPLSEFLPPLQPAFTIQSWFSTRKIAAEAVRVSFDQKGVVTRRAPDVFGIPIRVENVPEYLVSAPDWVSIESPWHSSWSATSYGANLLVLRVPPAEFERLKGASIHIRGSLDLTLQMPGTDPPADRRCWVEDDYAPYPTSPWFGPLTKCDRPEMFPVAHIRRSFDLGPIRLADAVVSK